MNDYERRAREGVQRTVFAAAKPTFGESACCPYVRYSIRTADPSATGRTQELLRFLHDAAARKAFLFGHQNAAHHGVSIKKTDGSDSDIKRISGSHPAVVGIDANSEGLAMARERGIATTHEGIEGLKALPMYDEIGIVFDATSAYAHKEHDAVLRADTMKRENCLRRAKLFSQQDRYRDYTALYTRLNGEESK